MSQLGDLYEKNLQRIAPLVGIGAFVILLGLLVVLFAFLVLPKSDDSTRLYFPATDPLDIKPYPGRPIPPMDVEAALAGTQEMLADGKATYAAQCQPCHGPEGKGNGPAGLALNPRPRNFTQPDGWKVGYKITDLYHTLSVGLGTVMPSFDVLTPEKRFGLAHYVQSLGHFNHGPEDATAVAFLNDKYQLAKGGREPNRVSVPFMMEYMVARSIDTVTLAMPPATDTSAGAALLRRAIDNPIRAARTLERAAGWEVSSASLAQTALLGAPGNGFAPHIGTFSGSQWQQLQQSLVQHIIRAAASGRSPQDMEK